MLFRCVFLWRFVVATCLFESECLPNREVAGIFALQRYFWWRKLRLRPESR